ncbi:hypothetical protein ALC60_08326, partial [Trachymyrmex zeteki]
LLDPKFKEPIANVTAPVGREAILSCVVQDLAGYKVAWLRVDTQTILTIATHVITKNHRIAVSHSDHRTWFLHIREVRESDRGWYMCQINTDPMKSQIGYLEVVEIFQTNANFWAMQVSLLASWLVQLTKWLLPQFEDCREIRCSRSVCCILYGLPARSSASSRARRPDLTLFPRFKPTDGARIAGRLLTGNFVSLVRSFCIPSPSRLVRLK